MAFLIVRPAAHVSSAVSYTHLDVYKRQIQGIKEPSISLTQELMKWADLIIATGGRPMVKSAYSAGVPAYGSGAGNATVIIDDTCNTPERQKEAAENTRISKTSDFGSGCSCDGNLLIHESVYDGFVKALEAEGAYLANEEEAEMLKKVMWDETCLLYTS